MKEIAVIICLATSPTLVVMWLMDISKGANRVAPGTCVYASKSGTVVQGEYLRFDDGAHWVKYEGGILALTDRAGAVTWCE